MKFFQKLNNFAEKWGYHKNIGNGKAIFYYRSFWNVIFRRKCNKYVVNVGDVESFDFMLTICVLFEHFVLDKILKMYISNYDASKKIIAFLIVYTAFYHTSALYIFIKKTNKLTN